MRGGCIELARLVTILLVAATASATWAQEYRESGPPARTMSIHGEGRYEVAPELVTFSASLETRGETLEAARDPHPVKAAKARAILDSLAAKGLQIERSTYSFYESRPYQYDTSKDVTEEMRERVVYIAGTNFQLRTRNLAEIADIITAVAAGEMEVTNASFEVDDERAPLLMARRNAAEDAAAQAKIYADALGLELADIYSVVDGRAAPVDGVADLGILTNADGSVPLSIVVPETIGFYASVDVVWTVELAP